MGFFTAISILLSHPNSTKTSASVKIRLGHHRTDLTFYNTTYAYSKYSILRTYSEIVRHTCLDEIPTRHGWRYRDSRPARFSPDQCRSRVTCRRQRSAEAEARGLHIVQRIKGCFPPSATSGKPANALQVRCIGPLDRCARCERLEHVCRTDAAFKRSNKRR